MSTNKEDWEKLRAPFDKKVIGKIPKGGVQLDYVGHAAVTDRLLSVDPEWTWEPVALNEQGLPAYDAAGGLWIKLTVLGVTRLGYGDGPDPKQRIGDALRNAAMRFGVALDLWTKDELESHLDAPELKNDKPTDDSTLPPGAVAAVEKLMDTAERVAPDDPFITEEQVAELMSAAKLKGYISKPDAIKWLTEQSGLGHFTKLPVEEFARFKKLVIESGWKDSDPVKPDPDIDLTDVPF